MVGVGAVKPQREGEGLIVLSQAQLKDPGLVCSRNRIEFMAGSYLLVTSSPIPSLKSLFINLLKESNLTLSSWLAVCQKPVLPL